MTEVEIIIGADTDNPLYRFLYSKRHIMNASGVASSSMAGDELAIDRITFTVNLEYYRETLYSPTDADAYQDTEERLYAVRSDPYEASERLRTLPNATPVRVYYGGELFAKFYSGDVKRVGMEQFTITASSAMQVLEDAPDHAGGIYAGKSFIDLLVEIIGGTKGTAVGGVIPVTGGLVNFYVTSAVASVRVYGWLPKAKPRENIHQMLFAHGVNIMKGDDGDMLFDYLTSVTALDVPEDRVFLKGSVTYTPPATRVELTEHSYVSLATDEEVVLMNNLAGGVPSDETIITFGDGPVHDLTTQGELSIIESGVNYAKIRGVGVLKGKKYHHTTTLLAAESDSVSGEKKTAVAGKCTLISPLNGDAVLERLVSYYLSARTIQADLSVDTERPGNTIRFQSVFGELETAFIASMNYRLTSFERATCTLIAGYAPANSGNEYKNVQLVTASGTWTVPNGVEKIMVVVIGGGTGGGSGGNGGQASGAPVYGNAPYPSSFSTSQTVAGIGGSPGTPGKGGKIYRATLDVSQGQQFSVSIGTGGMGAPVGSAVGNPGGDTTFGAVSSASGYSSGTGFTDLISGNTYATSGTDGISGADGDGPKGTRDIVVDGVRYTHGSRGSTVSDSKSTSSGGYSASGSYSLAGGYGGGPAYKSNGGAGRSGKGGIAVHAWAGMSYGSYNIPGGSGAVVAGMIAVGGNGANAQKPPNATIRGQGGSGGNGGGGVGAFGAPAQTSASASTSVGASVFYSENDPGFGAGGGSGPLGTPGKGSAGGDGAPGCVLIYY